MSASPEYNRSHHARRSVVKSTLIVAWNARVAVDVVSQFCDRCVGAARVPKARLLIAAPTALQLGRPWIGWAQRTSVFPPLRNRADSGLAF